MRTSCLLFALAFAVTSVFAFSDKETLGYGAGDTLGDAIVAAKRDAVINASGVDVNVSTESVDDELKSESSWHRGGGMVRQYEIVERGESVEGIYVRIKAQVSPAPSFRPLKESASIKGKLDEQTINWVRTFIKDIAKNPLRDVIAVGFGDSEQDALADAKRSAVEKAFGGYIESAAKVKDDVVAREQMISTLNAYIENFSVQKSEKKDDGYTCQIKASVRFGGGQAGFLRKGKPPAPLKGDEYSQRLRSKEGFEAISIELGNLKSVVPYLYEVRIVDASPQEDGRVNLQYRVGVNQEIYKKVFLPRLLFLLSQFCVRPPVEMQDLGTYDLLKNSVELKSPRGDSVDAFGVTVVDQIADGKIVHGYNFSLPGEWRRMVREWRNQEFESQVAFTILAKDESGNQIFESERILVDAGDLRNTPVPYFARGWGFWFDDIWLPFLSDKRVEIKGNVTACTGKTFDVKNCSVKVVMDRPRLDIGKIKGAKDATDDPTFWELVLSVIVRIGLSLLVILDLAIIISAFKKSKLLGAVALLIGLGFGLFIVGLIIS